MPMSPTLMVPRDDVPWDPSQWATSRMAEWFHGGLPARGTASTIQGGVGNTTTGWNDASGNSRHMGSGTPGTPAGAGGIGGTPDVVKPNLLEGINFARGSAEYLLRTAVDNAAFTAPSDTAGGWWVVIRTNGTIAENLPHSICGYGASGSGTKYIYQMLETASNQLGPKILGQKNSGVQSSTGPQTANTIVADTVYSILFEADQTGGTWRMFLNESQVATSNSGTVGTWFSAINTDSQLNRFAIGTHASNSGVSTNYWNGHIYEVMTFRGALGSDETNVLAHLARQRAAA